MSVQNSSFIGPVFKIQVAGALVSTFARQQTKKNTPAKVLATARVLQSLNALMVIPVKFFRVS